METKELAVAALLDGASCAQAVFGAYSERYGISVADSRRIVAGFGGGFASGLTCGVVTGGCVVLGLELASHDLTDAQARETTYGATQKLLARFAERNGSHQCAEILASNNMALETEEDRLRLRDSGLCIQMVECAVDCIDEIIAESVA